MKRSKTIVGVLAVALVLTLAGAAQAAVTYFGADIDGTKGAWRTALDVTENKDIDGDGKYGTDGYFIASEADDAGGVTGWGNPTVNLESKPGYVTSLGIAAWDAAVWVYDCETLDQPSALYIDTPDGTGTSRYGFGLRQPNSNGDVLSFALEEDASFRLGIFNDAIHANYDVDDYFEVRQSGGTTASDNTGSSLTLNQQIDYYFFDLSGQKDDVFTLAAFRGSASQGTFVKGIVFDSVIPEPATMSLLALGGLGVLIRRKKRA